MEINNILKNLKLIGGLALLCANAGGIVHAESKSDADVILLLSAVDEEQESSLLYEAQNWIDYRTSQGYSIDHISLYQISDYYGKEPYLLTQEEIRVYLKNNITSRHATQQESPKGRYLGILGHSDWIWGETISTNQEVSWSSNFTLEWYFKPALNTFSNQYIISLVPNLSVSLSLNNIDFRQYDNVTRTSKLDTVENAFYDANWHHFAVTYDMTAKKIRLFIDGVLKVDTSFVGDSTDKQNFFLANYYPQSASVFFDELRLSSNIRYKENFKAPTSPFVSDSYTKALFHLDSENSSYQSYDVSNSSYIKGNSISHIVSSAGKFGGGLQKLPQLYKEHAYNGIPRFMMNVMNDNLYGFLDPEKMGGDNGIIDPNELDFSKPTLSVFRIPIRESGDLELKLDQSIAYEKASYKKDLTLVAGRYSTEGDTEAVMCAIERTASSASQIIKDFTTDIVCPADYISSDDEHSLNNIISGETTSTGKEFKGGLVYNISHGSSDAIYSTNFYNLSVDDSSYYTGDKLFIFTSLACSNDGEPYESSSYEPSNSLALSLLSGNAVSVISSTDYMAFSTLSDILIGEMTFVPMALNSTKTLSQSVQEIKSIYYKNYILNKNISDKIYPLNMLLSSNIYGDGLISLNR